MKTFPLVVFVALVSLKATGGEPSPGDNHAADRRAITMLGNAWAERFNARDPKGLANLYTEDCVRLPNEAKTTVGRQALAEQYAKEFAPAWEHQAIVVITTDEIVFAANYAFGRGTDTATTIENGAKKIETGKWMAVYRREPGGEWKFHWSTSNNDEPSKTPAG